ncbi:PIN domain-containing protein [Sphingomonas cavernae]|uniref:PIN domain-containing protein n=1 Tax=Sphingomonas cavernae TaxID=2320861 RepID=A0A418WL28_9SPHN|nr:PIN domain-containing protein [Sphingomonas cavernae]RJF90652.1 PIN domain-containing protein [Sphingomonas cavernae]
MAKIFLDSNVVIYAFTDDPRSSVAETLLSAGADLSVQVLNEFTNIARRKLNFDWSQIDEASKAIRVLARATHPVDLKMHESALALAQRYGFSFYDALIVAAALRARCDILHSENMQDGLMVEGILRIVNPFRNSTQKSE